MRIRRIILVFVMVVASSQAWTYAEPPQDLATTEQDVRATYDSVRPAIVKLEKDGRHIGSGVLITPDGHMLTSATAFSGRAFREEKIAILSDGRRMKAKPLGWSGEWNIGLLKVSDDAPFPHVPLGDEPEVPKPGRGCVAIGYPRQPHTGTEPVARFGSIALVCDPIWCTSTCPLWFDYGTGLFDLKGRLLGICTKVPSTSDPLFTLVAPVRDNWNELASGNNVDEVRLFRNKASAGGSSAQDNVTESDLKRAKAATVLISNNRRRISSGVIITEDGYIATCAHHKALPGEKVTVSLADGPDVPAEVLGMNRVTDVGLVRILAHGPWPYAEMGDSTLMKIDVSATIMGFPGSCRKRSPLVRRTRIVAAPRQESIIPSNWIHTDPESSQTLGGDSGGGLFDARGKLIGIHQMVGRRCRHIRVEAVRKQWDFLAAAKPVSQMEIPNPFGPESAFVNAAKEVTSTVVEILCDGRRACLGFILSSDGQIVTKNSELKGEVSCRLPRGDQRQAKVLRYSREHDLALLKIDATDLSAAEWSEVDPAVHTFIAAVLPDTPRPWGKFPKRDSPIVGLVTQSARPIPGEPGSLGRLRDTDKGLEILREAPRSELPLKKSDIIISVEGRPTPDLGSFHRVMQPSQATVLAYGGEPVRVKIRRDEETLDLRCVLAETPSNSLQDESVRRSGFPSAVDSDISLSPTECGAPVIDAKGNVSGIVIASRGRGQTHILTSSEVRRFLSEPRWEGRLHSRSIDSGIANRTVRHAFSRESGLPLVALVPLAMQDSID